MVVQENNLLQVKGLKEGSEKVNKSSEEFFFPEKINLIITQNDGSSQLSIELIPVVNGFQSDTEQPFLASLYPMDYSKNSHVSETKSISPFKNEMGLLNQIQFEKQTVKVSQSEINQKTAIKQNLNKSILRDTESAEKLQDTEKVPKIRNHSIRSNPEVNSLTIPAELKSEHLKEVNSSSNNANVSQKMSVVEEKQLSQFKIKEKVVSKLGTHNLSNTIPQKNKLNVSSPLLIATSQNNSKVTKQTLKPIFIYFENEISEYDSKNKFSFEGKVKNQSAPDVLLNIQFGSSNNSRLKVTGSEQSLLLKPSITKDGFVIQNEKIYTTGPDSKIRFIREDNVRLSEHQISGKNLSKLKNGMAAEQIPMNSDFDSGTASVDSRVYKPDFTPSPIKVINMNNRNQFSMSDSAIKNTMNTNITELSDQESNVQQEQSIFHKNQILSAATQRAKFVDSNSANTSSTKSFENYFVGENFIDPEITLENSGLKGILTKEILKNGDISEPNANKDLSGKPLGSKSSIHSSSKTQIISGPELLPKELPFIPETQSKLINNLNPNTKLDTGSNDNSIRPDYFDYKTPVENEFIPMEMNNNQINHEKIKQNELTIQANGKIVSGKINPSMINKVNQSANIVTSFTDSLDFISTLSKQFQIAIKNQTKEVFIQLKPEHLGLVKLKLKMENEKLSGRIEVSSVDVHQMLVKNSKDLNQRLSDLNISLESLEYDLMDSSKERESDGSSRSSQQSQKSGMKFQNIHLNKDADLNQQKRVLGYNTFEFIA
jgi:flagellar hook-length control protein FliK